MALLAGAGQFFNDGSFVVVDTCADANTVVVWKNSFCKAEVDKFCVRLLLALGEGCKPNGSQHKW